MSQTRKHQLTVVERAEKLALATALTEKAHRAVNYARRAAAAEAEREQARIKLQAFMAWVDKAPVNQ